MQNELKEILKNNSPLTLCAANKDEECSHKTCPQLRDNEPCTSGRHCPIDNGTMMNDIELYGGCLGGGKDLFSREQSKLLAQIIINKQVQALLDMQYRQEQFKSQDNYWIDGFVRVVS